MRGPLGLIGPGTGRTFVAGGLRFTVVVVALRISKLYGGGNYTSFLNIKTLKCTKDSLNTQRSD